MVVSHLLGEELMPIDGGYSHELAEVFHYNQLGQILPIAGNPQAGMYYPFMQSQYSNTRRQKLLLTLESL
jgi:hypothetical protein